MNCCPTFQKQGAGASGAPGGVLPTGGVGNILVFNGTLWVPVDPLSTLLSRALLTFGAAGVSNGTNYLFAGGSDDTNTVATRRRIFLPYSCTLEIVGVVHNTPAGASDVTYVVEKNDVAEAMTVVLASNASEGFSMADQVAFTAGDTVCISAQQASGGPLAIAPVFTLGLILQPVTP